MTRHELIRVSLYRVESQFQVQGRHNGSSDGCHAVVYADFPVRGAITPFYCPSVESFYLPGQHPQYVPDLSPSDGYHSSQATGATKITRLKFWLLCSGKSCMHARSDTAAWAVPVGSTMDIPKKQRKGMLDYEIS